ALRVEEDVQGAAVAPGDAERLRFRRLAHRELLFAEPAGAQLRVRPRLVKPLDRHADRLAAADLVAVRRLVLLAQAARPLVADGEHLLPPGAGAGPGEERDDPLVIPARASGGVQEREPLVPALAGLRPDGVVRHRRRGGVGRRARRALPLPLHQVRITAEREGRFEDGADLRALELGAGLELQLAVALARACEEIRGVGDLLAAGEGDRDRLFERRDAADHAGHRAVGPEADHLPAGPDLLDGVRRD